MNLFTKVPRHLSRSHKLRVAERRPRPQRPIEAAVAVPPLTREVLEAAPSPLTPEYVAGFCDPKLMEE